MPRLDPPGRMQQAVRHLVHGTVAARGHDMARPRADRARGELDAVPGTSGTLGHHTPALAPELADDRVERARRRAAPGGGVEDEVGMDQRPIISIEARSGSGSGLRHQAGYTSELAVTPGMRPGSVEP